MASAAAVLILTPYYLPGYKAGGPIRSLVNLTEALGDEYRFRIVTYDRDLGDKRRYPDIRAREWVRSGRAEVYYVPPGVRLPREIAGIMRRETYDVLYLTGVFEPGLTILPLILRRLGAARSGVVAVSPRGGLLEPALGVKSAKKRAYLHVAKALGLYKALRWHATSRAEADAIERVFGRSIGPHEVVIANNLASRTEGAAAAGRTKTRGLLRLAYLGRINRIKNLDFAIWCLSQIEKGQVEYAVYGPIEDARYWEECQALAATLPSGVRVRYEGTYEPTSLGAVLAEHDAFFLPTKTENFGHSIIEALSAGLPALVSDHTPWRGLERAGAGWDLPLDQPNRFVDAIRALIAADEETLLHMRVRAREYASVAVTNESELDAYRSLLRPGTP